MSIPRSLWPRGWPDPEAMAGSEPVTGAGAVNRCLRNGATSAVAGGPDPAASAKRNLSPLIVVGHGAFAVTTMLLVLLAALGVGAG